MALQPFLKIHTFTGISNENFDEFESLLRAGIAVGAIAEAQQPAFLKLNLSGGALRFYSGLADATRNDLDDALTALRDRYNQTANQEFHRIKFHERKFDSVKESPEDYIVELQRLALRAFPNVAAGAHGAAIDCADERTRRVKEAFIQGMPIKFKRKLLKEPKERTVEELGRQITRELWIMNAYPDDSYPGAFQQLGYSDDNTVQLNLLQNNQVKMHDELSKKLDNMTSQLENSIHNSNSLERSEGYCPLTMSVRAGPLTLPVLIDTGAFTSALSIDVFKQIELQSPSSIRNKISKPDFEVCVASNDPVDVLFCCEIEFDLPVGSFIENFLVLPKMKDILLGISFCTKNNLVIDFQNRLLKFPDFTLQLNRLKKIR